MGITREDKKLFANKLSEIKAMPEGMAKQKRITEVIEMIESYHIAIELGYPRSCLDKIIKADNIIQVSNIMATERRKAC